MGKRKPKRKESESSLFDVIVPFDSPQNSRNSPSSSQLTEEAESKPPDIWTKKIDSRPVAEKSKYHNSRGSPRSQNSKKHCLLKSAFPPLKKIFKAIGSESDPSFKEVRAKLIATLHKKQKVQDLFRCFAFIRYCPQIFVQTLRAELAHSVGLLLPQDGSKAGLIQQISIHLKSYLKGSLDPQEFWKLGKRWSGSLNRPAKTSTKSAPSSIKTRRISKLKLNCVEIETLYKEKVQNGLKARNCVNRNDHFQEFVDKMEEIERESSKWMKERGFRRLSRRE